MTLLSANHRLSNRIAFLVLAKKKGDSGIKIGEQREEWQIRGDSALKVTWVFFVPFMG